MNGAEITESFINGSMHHEICLQKQNYFHGTKRLTWPSKAKTDFAEKPNVPKTYGSISLANANGSCLRSTLPMLPIQQCVTTGPMGNRYRYSIPSDFLNKGAQTFLLAEQTT